MKKYIQRILLLVLISVSAAAAQDFSGIKIYINPGHGGNDSNDRYIPQTGYWESEGNLTKGLYLRDLLEQLGATVLMSRTQNRTVDDRSLSEIDAEANANNVDVFHSIHTNALNGNTYVNYPLLLFHGYNDNPAVPGSERLGNIIWTEMDKMDRQWTYWQNSYAYNRGDLTLGWWGTGGLGVLRYLDMPGTLSEGSFHDYFPNSWRLQCTDYRKHESIVLLRSFIDYFELERLPHGIAAGIVRAKNLNVDYSYSYNSGLPNDKKQALDYAKVTLLPDNKVYITDGSKNGFFMFDSLQAGTYSVVFDAGEFKPDTVQVTVSADETSFANGYLEQNPDKPPYVLNTIPAAGDSAVNTYTSIEAVFSRPMDVNPTQNSFSISPKKSGTFSWHDDNRKLKFKPDTAYSVSQVYEVNFSDSARSIFGISLDTAYAFSYKTSAVHDHPRVSSYSPSASVDSVFTHTEVIINFNQSMDQAESEAEFSISPAAPGSFKWENNNKKMIFKSHDPLEAGTDYQVLISKDAKNSYFVGLKDFVSFTFKTRLINSLDINRSFPLDGENHVNPKMYFYLEFDKEIVEDTFSSDNFILQSAAGDRIYIRKLSLSSNGDIRRITFKPKKDLESSADYTLSIYPGIASVEGYSVQDTLMIHFQTDSGQYTSGSVLESFENINNWQEPLSNELTAGMDSAATYFIKTSSVKINGSYSGRLIYGFKADSGGFCRIYNFNRPSLGTDYAAEFGLWIFGDFSGNYFESWFDHGDSTDYTVVQKKIDWYGWKLVRFPISDIPGSGEVFFQSIAVRQNPEGYKSSELYFDDLQTNIVVGIEGLSSAPITGKDFKLAQCYPNPFNPDTNIEFVLPVSCKAELTVYNILGQKVKELVNDVLPAGKYRYRYEAGNSASGIYFYELKTEQQVLRKRMILLK